MAEKLTNIRRCEPVPLHDHGSYFTRGDGKTKLWKEWRPAGALGKGEFNYVAIPGDVGYVGVA